MSNVTEIAPPKLTGWIRPWWTFTIRGGCRLPQAIRTLQQPGSWQTTRNT